VVGSTLQQWLSGEITKGTLPGPDVNPVSNTVYLIYFPNTTAIEFDGMKSCDELGFDGYHNSMVFGAQQIAYVVVVECSPPPPLPSVPQLGALESATITASHEIVEASTDPSILKAGYYLDAFDTSTWGWMDIAGGGEVADLCIDPFGLGQDETADGTFTVQRIWSNEQAASGMDPCTPIPFGEVYFNAAPRQSFLVLDVGASVTFDVDAFSTGPMGDWTLSAQDWSDSVTTSYLAFSFAGATQTDAGAEIQVNNGSTVQVTVTLLEDPGQLDTGEADGAIVSVSREVGNPLAAHWWPFVVMSPADAADAGIDQGQHMRHLLQPPRVHRVQRKSLAKTFGSRRTDGL
jgi:hypothetical protein